MDNDPQHTETLRRLVEATKAMEAELARLVAENRRQAALLDSIFEVDPSGMAVVVGPDLLFAYANPAYRFVCPRHGEHLTDQPYDAVWSEQPGNSFSSQIREVLQTGKPFQTLGFERQFSDGSTRTFTFQVRRIAWDLSQPAALLILWDTTDLKRIETALRQAQEATAEHLTQLRTVLENMSEGLFLLDGEGNILLANQAMLALSGVESFPRDALSKYASRIEAYDARGRLLSVDELPPAKAMRGEVVRDEEYFVHRLDTGRCYTALYNAVPIRDPDGRVKLIVITVRDITRDKAAEQTLRESENRLKRAQEISHLGSWELDLVSNQLTWSDEVYRIFGLQPQEFGATYEAFLEAVHPDDRAAVDAAYSGSIRDHRDTYEIDHRVVRKSTGEIRAVHEKCEHIRDASGRIIRSIGMVQDITERKQVEEERRKLLVAVEQSPTTIVITDVNGAIEYVNPRFSELTGYSAEEALGQNPRILKSGLTPRSVYASLWKTIGAGETWRGEFCNRKRSGELYWESASISPITRENGQITHFLAVKQDITEQKQAELSLKKSEERYRNLFTSISEGFALHEILCDPAGKPVDYRFLEVNPAFEQMTGLTREMVQGRTVLEALPGTESYWIETYGEVALTGKPARFQNYSQALGKYFEVVAFSPEPGQFATLFVDVTQQKRLEDETKERAAQIEVQRRLLEQREQERLQIARDLHDGPVQELTGVNYQLEGMLHADFLRSDDAAIVDKLRALRETIQDQISELRAYASELRPPTLAKFGLGKAIRSHSDTFQEKHPEIRIHFEEAQTGSLLPDEMRVGLFRIYQEALTNIAKHAQATEIRIRFEKTAELAVLEIRDNGVGFEVPQDWLGLARQGHLGLVGLRERAEAIGGTVEISSHPGQGTCVQVTVPLRNPSIKKYNHRDHRVLL